VSRDTVRVQPETRYARSGDVNVAYQVVGEGPFDLVYGPGWVSNIEMMWEEPDYADFLARLASFSRLILFDKRGTGLSDRVLNDRLPTLEQRMTMCGQCSTPSALSGRRFSGTPRRLACRSSSARRIPSERRT
jgi:pimeloyl-ACP methyl ester carboxylesterase